MSSRTCSRVGLRLIAVMAALALTAIVSGCSRGVDPRAPLAAVSDAKGLVAIIDLQRGKVVRTVRMRSFVSDIEADAGTGTFVTAQTGGVGDEADDKIGIIPARTGGRARYVRLPRPNPSGVEVIGAGRAVVDHGWDEKGGMFVCTVDTRARRVLREGHVPDNNVPMKVIDGVGWASCAAIDGTRSLRRVDLDSLDSTITWSGVQLPMIGTDAGRPLAGWLITEPGEARIALFDAKTGAVETSAPVEFEDGPGSMAHCRDRLVAVDFSGEDITRPGCRLLVFDPKTLAVLREIRLTGGPTDIAVWRDRVVVANFLDQTVQVIDPVSGTVDRTIQLPKMVDLQLYLAVLD